MRHTATGLGIRSADPRHWLPDPSKSVIMSKSRLRRFIKGYDHPAPITPSFAFGTTGVTGRIGPAVLGTR
jgi:hypothetical protein